MEWLADIFQGLGGFKSVAGLLGVSVLGLLGVIRRMRTAIKETVEAVDTINKIFAKYKDRFKNDKQLKKDIKLVETEVDESLEAVADVIERIPFLKKYAKKLRNILYTSGQ